MQEDSLISGLKGQVTGLKLQLADANSKLAELQQHSSRESAVHIATKQKHDHLWQSQLLQQQSVADKAATNEQLHQELLGKLRLQQQQQQEHMQLLTDLQSSKQTCETLSERLAQCFVQHQQEIQVLSNQLANAQESSSRADTWAQQTEQQMQKLQQQHLQEQQLLKQQKQQLQEQLQQMARLRQQLQEQAESHADVSTLCRQLKQDLTAALSDKHSAAEQIAALQHQLAVVTATLNSNQETHSSEVAQAEFRFAQQQHHSQAVISVLKQEVQALQGRLATKAQQPSMQAAAVQTSVSSRDASSQAGSDACSLQCQDAEQAMQVKTLQVFPDTINVLLHTLVTHIQRRNSVTRLDCSRGHACETGVCNCQKLML